jgi:hypothetical protein
MFRRTMAVITAQQPDGEIALGIQLKHAARRAVANGTTSGYASETPGGPRSSSMSFRKLSRHGWSAPGLSP